MTKHVNNRKTGACMVVDCHRPVAYLNPITRSRSRGYCVQHKALAVAAGASADNDADSYERSAAKHAAWRVEVSDVNE